MVHIEFDCSYEKAKLLLKVAELYDEGGTTEFVRKAYWRSSGYSYLCSNCDTPEGYRPNYCPNCGAKMEKKEK